MYQDTIKGWLKHFDFILWDIVCLEAALLLAYLIRSDSFDLNLPTGYSTLAWQMILISFMVAFFRNGYSSILRRGILIELKETIYHCTSVIVLLIVTMFVTKVSADFSRAAFIMMYFVAIALVFFMRLLWKKVVQRYMKGVKEVRQLLLISNRAHVESDIAGLVNDYEDYVLGAVVVSDDVSLVGKRINDVAVVASAADEVYQYISQNIVDEVVWRTTDEQTAGQYIQTLINMGITVHEIITHPEFAKYNCKVQALGHLPVLSGYIKTISMRQAMEKRALDIVGGIIGTILSGVVLLIFGPIIYIQSPGPIFFKQKRVGKNGRVFWIYKFRTMYPDAEERKKELMAQNKIKGLMFKLDDDPRIIPIGRFLRKTSLDEFPQFLNVLKGEMSLVGTRPPTTDEYAQYEPHHRRRLAIRPGITGLWQVSGRSDITDFEQVVELDTEYIVNWNMRLDIKILWRTVREMLFGRGAV